MRTRDDEYVGAVVKSEDSALGRWITAHWEPPRSSPLFGLIEAIWYFEGTMAHPKERVFPDGIAKLIVMLDDPHRDGCAKELDPFPRVCMSGLTTRPEVVVSPPGRCRVVGICFHPNGASALLRSSMRSVLDITIDLRDALGIAADQLGEQCADAAEASAWNPQRNAQAVVQAAAGWASARLIGHVLSDPMVDWTVETVHNTRGSVSMEKIGSAMGVTRVRLAQRFRDRVGVTPKRFARIVRFRHALSLLGQSADAATAAAELSYYDQAHMYRDFSEFAGMTPGEFLAANRYPGSSSLAEP